MKFSKIVKLDKTVKSNKIVIFFITLMSILFLFNCSVISSVVPDMLTELQPQGKIIKIAAGECLYGKHEINNINYVVIYGNIFTSSLPVSVMIFDDETLYYNKNLIQNMINKYLILICTDYKYNFIIMKSAL